MEIKITADKKLLDMLDKLAEAVRASAQPATAALEAVAAKAKELAAPAAEPATAAPAAPQPQPEPAQATQAPADAPTRDEVRRVAVTRIQAGRGAAVKALVTKYGAARVNDVPEDKLAEFKAELEAL